ncbi:MAG: hypothetical protein ABR574_03945 [Cryomorphaceae bacterium]|nr:hypothetical protein [Flavobacteriales bacterium]
MDKVAAKYGDFASIYSGEIMQVGAIDNPMTAELLGRFSSDPTWVELQAQIEKQFPDLSNQSRELESAFKRYSILFDADTLPKLVAYNSGFNIGIYPTPNWLGIGLEWYAGTDYPLIKRLPPDLFPQYKRDKFKPGYLVPNALKGWLLMRFQDEISEESLLGRMVFSGKILYITSVLMEEESDARLLNYTPEQYQWCTDESFSIWRNLVERDLLFDTDAMEINKWMNDGPFTPGMPPESPGGVGNWIGLEMVKAYMDKNENTNLVELMANKNNREFLKYYKPVK